VHFMLLWGCAAALLWILLGSSSGVCNAVCGAERTVVCAAE
jgi:hypothetical protein